ncbi:hypothetical protein [Streptomyces litchfieldiae]|uniref:Uncharacterized protein n=1 Tax=Streptomyces litchfieldiae TaxID=3075543 RepID=A0ABU2MPN6_9ACTN|nr:hypothetical protein [Streptomyces sp. DSM 44938]MDT0343470.1 hypothetical protein [Streptomyces sp. DSM 44938]
MRQAMLREALEIIRLLWQGGYRSYEGRRLRLVTQNAGPDPDGFLEFCRTELDGRLRALTPRG